MLGRWVTHAVIYLSVCSTVSLMWVMLTSGTIEDLKGYAQSPGTAFTVDFPPIWVWLFWGLALAMHAAIVLGRLISGKRSRRRQQRYVVVMFTDLTGSTAANERLGDRAWVQLVEEHRQLVRKATKRHGGIEVNTQGDGFFVRFRKPDDAVHSAVEIQHRSAEARAANPNVPPVRVGIHVGDAVHAGTDVLGTVVNTAARLLDAAEPNEIVVTEALADGCSLDAFDDRGLVQLKGLRRPRHLLSLRYD